MKWQAHLALFLIAVFLFFIGEYAGLLSLIILWVGAEFFEDKLVKMKIWRQYGLAASALVIPHLLGLPTIGSGFIFTGLLHNLH